MAYVCRYHGCGAEFFRRQTRYRHEKRVHAAQPAAQPPTDPDPPESDPPESDASVESKGVCSRAQTAKEMTQNMFVQFLMDVDLEVHEIEAMLETFYSGRPGKSSVDLTGRDDTADDQNKKKPDAKGKGKVGRGAGATAKRTRSGQPKQPAAAQRRQKPAKTEEIMDDSE